MAALAQIKIFPEDLPRLKRFGVAGDSLATAMKNVLDQAEKAAREVA